MLMRYCSICADPVGRVLLIILAFLVLGGCAKSRFLEALVEVTPFWSEDPTEGGSWGLTPVEKMEHVRALADAAASMDPADRERLAADLVERIRSENDVLIRMELVRTLSYFPTPLAGTGLRNALADSDPDVRRAACQAWRQYGGPDATAALSDALSNDADPDVRLAAIRALDGVNDPAALRALSLALDDANPAIQRRSIDVLRTISQVDYGQDIAAWRQFAHGGTPPAPPRPSLAERLFDRF